MYIDSSPITQRKNDGSQAPNLFGIHTAYHTIGSSSLSPVTSASQAQRSLHRVITFIQGWQMANPHFLLTRCQCETCAVTIELSGVAKAAARNGHHPSYEKRARPLKVSGVGQGAQACVYDCRLPVALRRLDNSSVSVGHLTTPTVSYSDLPGLLGLTARSS